MGNSPNNQPTVANEKWLTEGRKIHKQYRFTFFFASFLGTIICTPLSIIFVGFVVPLPMHVIGTDTVEAWGAFDRPEHLWIFAPIVMICIPLLMMSFGPLYGGLCYMGLQSMRGRKPRIRDIFRGFERFWGTLFLWLIFPTGVLILVSTGVGVFIVPLLWAVAMLAFPLLIDQKLSTIAAMSTAFPNRVDMEKLVEVLVIWIGFGFTCLHWHRCILCWYIYYPSTCNLRTNDCLS